MEAGQKVAMDRRTDVVALPWAAVEEVLAAQVLVAAEVLVPVLVRPKKREVGAGVEAEIEFETEVEIELGI